jgi:hypothetical protein
MPPKVATTKIRFDLTAAESVAGAPLLGLPTVFVGPLQLAAADTYSTTT